MTGSTADRRRNSRLICSVTRRFWPDVDPELVVRRRIVAAIAAVGDDALEARADLALHVGNDLFQRVAVIGIARQRRDMGDELPAFRAIERGGDGDFHAELVWTMRLALADAFDLGRVQGIDFSASLVLALVAHPFGQPQGLDEYVAQGRLAPDLAGDVAHDAAQHRAEPAQLSSRALELLRVGIALIGDQGVFADPLIGLAQTTPCFLASATSFSRARCISFGVGGMGDGLWLHGGVDDHLGEVRRLRRPGFRRNRQAFLDQGHEPFLAHPLAPARHRRAVEHQLVLEELFAAEQLEIWVFQPPRAKRLVGEVVHVFEDGAARHEPRGQRRMAWRIRINRAQPLFEKAPIDRSREFGRADASYRRSGRAAPEKGLFARCPCALSAAWRIPKPRRSRQ